MNLKQIHLYFVHSPTWAHHLFQHVTASQCPSSGQRYCIRILSTWHSWNYTQISLISRHRQNWLATESLLSSFFFFPLLILPFPHLPLCLLSFPILSSLQCSPVFVMGNAQSVPQVIAFSRMQSNVLSLPSFSHSFILSIFFPQHKADNWMCTVHIQGLKWIFRLCICCSVLLFYMQNSFSILFNFSPIIPQHATARRDRSCSSTESFPSLILFALLKFINIKLIHVRITDSSCQ